MNQRIETPPVTQPHAIAPYEALAGDVGHRLQAIGKAVVEALELDHADAADRVGELLSQLSHEYSRLGSVREQMYEAAGEANAEEASRHYEARFHVSDPRDAR